MGLDPGILPLLKRSVLVILIFEIIKIIPPYIFKRVIDTLVAYDPTVGFDIRLLLFLLGGYLVSMTIMAAYEVFQIRHLIPKAFRIERDLMLRALGKLLSLEISYHQRENTGAKLSRIFKGCMKVVDFIFRGIESIVPAVMQSIVTLIVLLFFSGWVALVYVIFCPIFIYVLYRDAMTTQKAREKIQQQYEEASGIIGQSVFNVRTVKDFDCEDHEIGKAKAPLERYLKAIDIRNWIGAKNTGMEDSLINVARVMTLAIAVYLMTQGKMTPGTLVFVVTLTEKGYLNLQRLSRGYFMIQDSAPSIDRLKRLMDEPIHIKDNPEGHDHMAQGRIRYNDVYFAYKKGKYALKGIDIEIVPKSVVALVGRSGSGKTTAAHLLLRHHDPTKGAITIDGIDLRDYRLSALRKNISIVSQEVEVFNDTLANNIAYGMKSPKRKDIIRCAKLANAHDFIMKLDKGYDTLIGERGVRLSGGQRQRLAIARALMRDPKIMVFDEATSSLDAESEKTIHDAILGLAGKLTLVIIAHRFSTINHADKIILLEDGKVKEVGTHKELMQKKGIFARLHKLQELGEVR